MKNENKIIRSLWIGPPLSALEQLSIKSFLSNDHIFHLYVYEDIDNIPDGVVVLDANEVVKENDIFLGHRGDKKFLGYEAFSDYFRYCLLYKYGGWWTDLDVVCLQPFDFSEKYVFASHFSRKEKKKVTASGCVMKLPPKSEEALYCINKCRNIKDKTTINYKDIGPRLVSEVIEHYDRRVFIQKQNTFCPINWWETFELIKANREFRITPEMFGIHFFNVRWFAEKLNKNSEYDKYSIYEQLKCYYNV